MLNVTDNVNFRGWKQDVRCLVPRKFIGYSKHTPAAKQYKEFQYMPELNKSGFANIRELIKSGFNAISDRCKEIVDIMGKVEFRKAFKDACSSAWKQTINPFTFKKN